MKIKRLSMTIVLLLALSIAGRAQNEDKVKAKIKKMAETSSKQMVSGEWSIENYAEDAISLPNNQPMMEGLEAIKANMEAMKAAGMQFEAFNLTPLKIWVNDKQVTEIGTYDLKLRMPDVPEPISDKGKYVNLWQIQEDGSLKLKVETWNTDVMPLPRQ